MTTSLLVLKLATTPLLIAIVTLIGRRWGPGVSGWFIGFPLVSAPISLVLALQYGPQFAAQAAVGSLGGQTSVCAYCLAYCLVAQAASWPFSIAAATASFLVLTFCWSMLSPGLLLTLVIDVVVVLATLRLIPKQLAPAEAVRHPAWDIPARMVIAAAFVLALTTFAKRLGPHLSGLVALLPVFTSIMAPFAHHQQGGAAAAQLLRGLVLGSVAFGAFYLVIVTCLPVVPITWSYLAATIASITANVAVLRFVQPHRPPQSPA
jgi:hypothetical protein